MRRKIFFIPSLIILSTLFVLPIQATHLDGLWRSDRNQITVRIEQEEDGFRAKRTDQGIWYRYTTDDNIHFTDRYGNWYELVDDEELVWNEANSGKRIYFSRVDDSNDYRWNDRDNDYDTYGNNYPDRWNDSRNDTRRNYIDGRWYTRNGKEDVEIVSFPGGIRVKTKHDGWNKFYADRTGNRFRDKYGNAIIIMDRENLRYRSQYGKHDLLLTCYRHGKHDGHDCRN